jgi:hypothetical protein
MLWRVSFRYRFSRNKVAWNIRGFFCASILLLSLEIFSVGRWISRPISSSSPSIILSLTLPAHKKKECSHDPDQEKEKKSGRRRQSQITSSLHPCIVNMAYEISDLGEQWEQWSVRNGVAFS